MSLLSKSDYDHTIEALEYFLEVWGDQLNDVEWMEKQALLKWLKLSKERLN